MGRQRGSGAEAVTRPGIGPACVLILAGCLGLGACGDSQDARDAREDATVFWETLRGEASDARLRKATPFMGGGVRFEHPAPLRTAHERSVDGDVWTFAYGAFELELWRNDGTLDAGAYLQNIADAMVDSHSAKVREPLADGRTVEVCGQTHVGRAMEMDLMGEVFRYEAFDLPRDHLGRGRILMLFDGIGVAGASRTAAATTDMVFSTLRCQPLPPDPSDAIEESA